MSEDRSDDGGRRVPSGRLSRLGHFGRLAGGLAGGMLAEGARRITAGDRPRVSDLLLTPGNVTKVVDRLSHLRGAAMKLGQLISMDAGDMLPPELADIMARLRENAQNMPPRQLQQVLAKQWGRDWRRRFSRFEPSPIAAASIGQVHRALTHDGRLLAVKVQYPGVRESIQADVDNVATLLRLSGLLPRELDISPLLWEAKRQLAEEADYLREAEYMARFGKLLADRDDILVPEPDHALTTDSVLAMTFIDGAPIETLAAAHQETRNAVMTRLIDLVLCELFEFGVMQTDPNFANYRFQSDTGRLVLLDFGASRDIEPATVEAYRKLLRSGLARDREAVCTAAVEAGFIGEGALAGYRDEVNRIIDVILREMNREGPFDFGERSFVATLRDDGFAMAQDRATWHLPPADLLFVQRKISGTALLAARLKARVEVRAMVEDWTTLIGT